VVKLTAVTIAATTTTKSSSTIDISRSVGRFQPNSSGLVVGAVVVHAKVGSSTTPLSSPPIVPLHKRQEIFQSVDPIVVVVVDDCCD
jgi:hypothetical protein